MNLDAQAVVLRLHTHRPELLDHGLRIWESLRKLWTQRMARPDLQRFESSLARIPERPRNLSEVGRSVVGTLKNRSQRPVSLFCHRQRIEHGRIAYPQPHLAEGDSHEVLGRDRVQVTEQAGEAIEFLLHAARTARGGDLVQPLVHLDHGGRLAR